MRPLTPLTKRMIVGGLTAMVVIWFATVIYNRGYRAGVVAAVSTITFRAVQERDAVVAIPQLANEVKEDLLK